jgi:hypothetical protein
MQIYTLKYNCTCYFVPVWNFVSHIKGVEKIFGPKRHKVTRDWEGSEYTLFTRYYQCYQIKEDEMGGACNTHEIMINAYNFSRNT